MYAFVHTQSSLSLPLSNGSTRTKTSKRERETTYSKPDKILGHEERERERERETTYSKPDKKIGHEERERERERSGGGGRRRW